MVARCPAQVQRPGHQRRVQGALAFDRAAGNVDSVYVAGRAVKREGALDATLVARALDLGRASRDHLFAQAGLRPGWGYRPPLQQQWRW